jgi:hypothetical protein
MKSAGRLPNPSTAAGRRVLVTTGGPDLLRQGGGVVFQSGDGTTWWEWWEPTGATFQVRRVLVPQRIIESFVPDADVDLLARAYKMSRARLYELSESPDPAKRVEALLMVAAGFGFDQLDDMPVSLTERALRDRWSSLIDLS